MTIDTDAALIAARDAVAAVRKAVGDCPWIRWGADVHEGIRYSGVALQDAHEKLLGAEESLTVAIYHRQAAGPNAFADDTEPLCTDKRCTTKGVANPNCSAERCLSCCLRYCDSHCERSEIEVAERRINVLSQEQ